MAAVVSCAYFLDLPVSLQVGVGVVWWWLVWWQLVWWCVCWWLVWLCVGLVIDGGQEQYALWVGTYAGWLPGHGDVV